MGRLRKQDNGARALFKRNLPQFHWTAIETGALSSGVPDCEYCTPTGITGWIEFKAWYREEGKACPKIRPAQIGWIEKRVRMGGKAFIGVLCEGKVYLVRGELARDLPKVLAEQVKNGEYFKNWREIGDFLGSEDG